MAFVCESRGVKGRCIIYTFKQLKSFTDHNLMVLSALDEACVNHQAAYNKKAL